MGFSLENRTEFYENAMSGYFGTLNSDVMVELQLIIDDLEVLLTESVRKKIPAIMLCDDVLRALKLIVGKGSTFSPSAKEGSTSISNADQAYSFLDSQFSKLTTLGHHILNQFEDVEEELTLSYLCQAFPAMIKEFRKSTATVLDDMDKAKKVVTEAAAAATASSTPAEEAKQAATEAPKLIVNLINVQTTKEVAPVSQPSVSNVEGPKTKEQTSLEVEYAKTTEKVETLKGKKVTDEQRLAETEIDLGTLQEEERLALKALQTIRTKLTVVQARKTQYQQNVAEDVRLLNAADASQKAAKDALDGLEAKHHAFMTQNHELVVEFPTEAARNQAFKAFQVNSIPGFYQKGPAFFINKQGNVPFLRPDDNTKMYFPTYTSTTGKVGLNLLNKCNVDGFMSLLFSNAVVKTAMNGGRQLWVVNEKGTEVDVCHHYPDDPRQKNTLYIAPSFLNTSAEPNDWVMIEVARTSVVMRPSGDSRREAIRKTEPEPAPAAAAAKPK